MAIESITGRVSKVGGKYNTNINVVEKHSNPGNNQRSWYLCYIYHQRPRRAWKQSRTSASRYRHYTELQSGYKGHFLECKQDLLVWQQGPTYMVKETYRSGKRDLSWSTIMVFSIVRIEGIEGTAKPLIGLLTLLGLPRLVCLPGLLGRDTARACETGC